MLSDKKLAQNWHNFLKMLVSKGKDMAQQYTWIKVEKGIRYREHPTRKHGVRLDKYFVLRYSVDGRMYQESLGWASKGITIEKARIALAKLIEAKRTGIGPLTLAQSRKEEQKKQEIISHQGISLHDFWINHYLPTQQHKAPKSIKTEEQLYRNWLEPVIKGTALEHLSSKHLEQIKRNMLKNGKSPATMRYAFAVISQIWTLATREQLITGICPVKFLSLPKRDNKRQRFLTKEEAITLLAELEKHSPTSYPLCIIALDCGLRFGEIASITWTDCNFEQDTILIRDPKARANRYAFMTKRVRKLLEDIPPSNGLIFLDKNANKLKSISKSFRIVADRLFNVGIDDPRQRVCFHTLRHTFASWLVEGGVSLYEVKELMGHADLTMTQRYSHLSPEGLRNAIKILEE